jgi:hypothetical protein
LQKTLCEGVNTAALPHLTVLRCLHAIISQQDWKAKFEALKERSKTFAATKNAEKASLGKHCGQWLCYVQNRTGIDNDMPLLLVILLSTEAQLAQVKEELQQKVYTWSYLVVCVNRIVHTIHEA